MLAVKFTIREAANVWPGRCDLFSFEPIVVWVGEKMSALQLSWAFSGKFHLTLPRLTRQNNMQGGSQ
jgi:hypothetical protein